MLEYRKSTDPYLYDKIKIQNAEAASRYCQKLRIKVQRGQYLINQNVKPETSEDLSAVSVFCKLYADDLKLFNSKVRNDALDKWCNVCGRSCDPNLLYSRSFSTKYLSRYEKYQNRILRNGSDISRKIPITVNLMAKLILCLTRHVYVAFATLR